MKILLVILIFSPYFVQIFSKKYRGLKEHLEPIARQHGFSVQKSANYNSFTGKVCFPDEDEDISASPAFAGLRSVVKKTFSVTKEVILEDRKGKTYIVHASIDFHGLFSKRVKRVRWKPDLKNIK